MQGYATDLEKGIAAEDSLIAQCTHVCRYATGAVGGRFMLRPEESAVLGDGAAGDGAVRVLCAGNGEDPEVDGPGGRRGVCGFRVQSN